MASSRSFSKAPMTSSLSGSSRGLSNSRRGSGFPGRKDDQGTSAPAVRYLPGTGTYSVKSRGRDEIWFVGKRYKLDSVLGSGSYGTVCKAWDTETKQFVAIKKISNVLKSKTHALRILREVSILRRMKHPHIVSLLDVMSTMERGELSNIYIVFNFAGTDLAKLEDDMTLDQIQRIMYQLLQAVSYLHQSRVIHRDIKPANVMLAEDLTVSLGDFGLARMLLPGKKSTVSQVLNEEAEDEENSDNDHDEEEEPIRIPSREYSAHVVTRWYRAPEVIMCNGLYGIEIDLWSIGCVFAELLSRLEPACDRRALFPGKSCFPLSASEHSSIDSIHDQLNVIVGVLGNPDQDTIKSLQCDPVTKQRLSGLPPHSRLDFADRFKCASPQALDLLQGLLRFDPRHRINVADALQHEFFRDLEDPPLFRGAANALERFDLETALNSGVLPKARLQTLLRQEITSINAPPPSPSPSPSPSRSGTLRRTNVRPKKPDTVASESDTPATNLARPVTKGDLMDDVLSGHRRKRGSQESPDLAAVNLTRCYSSSNTTGMTPAIASIPLASDSPVVRTRSVTAGLTPVEVVLVSPGGEPFRPASKRARRN
mmetsp:Transcript_11778/g.27029  ORF Transcript_11778/g.27029 Transcript_11778/m.27029 type:complete len:597 (-) Transcript_11778:297-2087(-)